jgi:hypothetical protein
MKITSHQPTGQENSVPTEEWTVKWKKNRNHRGEETVFSQRKAINLADEKRKLGYKVQVKKVSSRPQ